MSINITLSDWHNSAPALLSLSGQLTLEIEIP